MIKTFSLLCVAAALTGCASLNYPLPKCDGYSRRPLNRSMWQWEDNSNLNQKHSDTRSTTTLCRGKQGAAGFRPSHH
jgi:type IV secretion system protein VirB7